MHLYNDTEGPLSEEELSRAKATPRVRVIAVCAGLIGIGLRVYNLVK